ncbi:MAG: phosphate signaling complex protein PhoU [Deltaproteobacteria bacterium]|nr:phosphate signaling complex protein PhoU [Deltaproteobacteria bacterium]MCL5276300.1 phosphate signaling complex protein PhoU [Deltaproteobacteria bacterium]
MERKFDEELKELSGMLVKMGSLAQTMIHKSVKALTDRDTAMLREVYGLEESVNAMHVEIDDFCLKLLALRQPQAGDLRMITGAIKINTDLERLGDQAVNIAQRTESLLERPVIKPLVDIPRESTIAQKMVSDSLDAFIRKDVKLAEDVLTRDDTIDDINNQIFRELLTYMMSDHTTIPTAIDLIFVSKNLERIADHATNIAEDVIFMVIGKDIRHHMAIK